MNMETRRKKSPAASSSLSPPSSLWSSSALGQKKNCYVALTRPKSENWVSRSIIFFTYRERVEFSNIFFKVSKWGKLGRNAVKTHIYTSAFLSHWIQILANSSPKSDIKKKKKKKKKTLFFRILRSVGRGQQNKKKFGPIITIKIINMISNIIITNHEWL